MMGRPSDGRRALARGERWREESAAARFEPGLDEKLVAGGVWALHFVHGRSPSVARRACPGKHCNAIAMGNCNVLSDLVDLSGIEPLASSLRTRRSPS